MPQIARALRLKDHSTVLHGLRRAHGHDGKLIHKHEPLWTKEQFQNMAFADGVMQRLPPQAYERVNCEQIMAIGLSNLRRAVRRIPKRWTPNHVEEAA